MLDLTQARAGGAERAAGLGSARTLALPASHIPASGVQVAPACKSLLQLLCF